MNYYTLHRLFYVFGRLEAQLRMIRLPKIRHQRKIMATLEEVQAELAQLASDIAADKIEVQDKLTLLKETVKALQDQIETGGKVSIGDLDDLVGQITGLEAAVKDISEPAANS